MYKNLYLTNAITVPIIQYNIDYTLYQQTTVLMSFYCLFHMGRNALSIIAERGLFMKNIKDDNLFLKAWILEFMRQCKTCTLSYSGVEQVQVLKQTVL